MSTTALVWFLHGCLAELRGALRERGADLVIRAGRPERELQALARECGASALYFASDVSPFATARDRRVEEALPDGVDVRRQPGVFVADIGSVRPYTRDFYAHVLLNHPGNARRAHRREFEQLEWDDDTRWRATAPWARAAKVRARPCPSSTSSATSRPACRP